MLFITNPYPGLILLSFLYLQCHSKRFINLIFTFLFLNGAINMGLKFLFKVPLHESIYNHDCWYSFPSGHMQYGIVFWGIVWIYTNYSMKSLFIIISLLISSGWSMNEHHYHTPLEMIAAIFPATIILSFYILLSKRINFEKNNLILLNCISVIIQVIIITNIESPCKDYKFTWLWLNLGANLGFSIISLITKDVSEDVIYKLKIRVKSLLFYYICFLFILEIILAYQAMNLCDNEINSLICGILIPIVLFLTSKLYQKFNIANG